MVIDMHGDTKTLLNVSRRLLLDTFNTEQQIAKMLFVSETTLRQLYIAKFGMPPKRYIRHVKLSKARTLLRITDKTVTEIAHIIGYINTSKFTEAFRKLYGETPSSYRKSCVLSKDCCSGVEDREKNNI